MVPRLKGHMQFRARAARTVFETALAALTGRSSFRSRVTRLEDVDPDPDYLLRNALMIDLAFRDPADTEEAWTLVQGSENLMWAYMHVHLCAVDGDRTADRDFRKFEFGSR